MRAQAGFARGLELFNQREFFTCHEVWEEIWRPSRQPERLFLQGLIHFAVAFYHEQQKNPEGAKRQLSKGLRKLAGYLPRFAGIETRPLYEAGIERLVGAERGTDPGDFPRIQESAKKLGLKMGRSETGPT